jgi:CheY-like chemotaxis protein
MYWRRHREARLLRVAIANREASVTEGNRRIVRLAGRLSAAQVPELFNTWAGQGSIELDLTDLMSADAAGIEALQRIRRSGATLSGTPGYIQLQLHTAADPTASR